MGKEEENILKTDKDEEGEREREARLLFLLRVFFIKYGSRDALCYVLFVGLLSPCLPYLQACISLWDLLSETLITSLNHSLISSSYSKIYSLKHWSFSNIKCNWSN